MENTPDYWGLTTLFKFDDRQRGVVNDRQETVYTNNMEGRQVELKPGHKFVSNAGESENFTIPSNDTIRFSDKSIYEQAGFTANLLSIVNTLSRNLRDGQIIKGLEFLDFHYRWTKRKKRFLLFTKNYILTKSWIEADKRDKFTLFDKPLADWVADKEFKRKTPWNLLLLAILICIFFSGAIFLPDYRDIFIGAMIGGLATQIKEIFDLIKEKTTSA